MIYKPNIGSQNNDADQSFTKHEVQVNHQRIAALEKDVSDLTNLVEGLWNLLRAENHLSDQNLREAVEAVIEAKKHHKERKRGCKSCARFVSAQYKKCIYCGGELVGEFQESIF